MVEGRQAMMLTLASDGESNQYVIDELSDKKLALGGEFRLDDGDTTSDAFLVLSKKKKK